MNRQKRIQTILHQLEEALCPDIAGDQQPLQAANIEMGLDDLIGLTKLKKMAQRDIKACLRVGEVFPHTGLFGPGGLGKTAFAMAMAKDLGYFFVQVEGAAIKNREQLIHLLRTANENAVALGRHLLFFVDECHRLGTLQEVLYYPMTEWRVTTSGGDVRFQPFTVVAATTHPNMLMGSFISRLQNEWHLDRYDLHDIRQIVMRQFDKWGMKQDIQTADLIARRSLGIPRQAKNLCLKVRNTVLARGGDMVTPRDCEDAFELEGIDVLGLGEQHIKYLVELHNAGGVPKGLSAIAGRMGLSEDVVSGSIEPTLLSMGHIDLTGRGRVLTARGRDHLKANGVI
jgi:Holliday junction DNA helicase RuvB